MFFIIINNIPVINFSFMFLSSFKKKKTDKYTVQAKSLNTPLLSPVFKIPKFLQC